MKLVRGLSVIGVAAYLVLQGLYLFSNADSPMVYSAIGLIGLVAGALIFVSISCWADPKNEK